MLIILGRCLGVMELGGAAPEIVISGGNSSMDNIFVDSFGSNPLDTLEPSIRPSFFVLAWHVFSLRKTQRLFALEIETFRSSIFFSIDERANVEVVCPESIKLF